MIAAIHCQDGRRGHRDADRHAVAGCFFMRVILVWDARYMSSGMPISAAPMTPQAR